MTTFLMVFGVFLVFFVAMSIGVLMGRKPIAGSCGGVGAALKIDGYVCDFCGNDPNKCDSQESSTGILAIDGSVTEAVNSDDLSYDATDKNR